MGAAMMAIISKALFEAEARLSRPGDTLPLERYNSSNKALTALGSDGRLFLVTVRPPDERLWLVAVLERPAQRDGAWVAAPNRVAIRDITSLRAQIRFANGKGISAEAGALGMSLQTPRPLADEDVALLDGGAATAKPAKTSVARTKAPPATSAPPPEPPAASAPPPGKASATAAKATDLATAVRNQQHARALDLALDRWQTSRAPSLAELIARLSARAPTPAPKIATTDLAQATIDDVRMLVETSATLPPDPRIAATYVAMLLQPPFTSLRSRVVWTPLRKQLGDRHADPRALARLEPLSDDYTRVFGKTKMGEEMQRGVRRLVDQLRKRFATPADDDEARQLLALVEPAATTAPPPPARSDHRGDALLAAIYANPDDDDARLVYADWLLEHDDPRGDFINLQFRRHRGETLSPADDKREARLLKKHLKAWMGPLYGVTYKDENRFARGFLERCVFEPRGAATGKAMNHPAWSTVREIEVRPNSSGLGEAVLAQPVMRHLRTLIHCNGPLLDLLLKQEGFMLEELRLFTLGGVSGQRNDAERSRLWGLLLAGERLTQLRRLVVGEWTYVQPEQQVALLQSPLGRRLERVVFQSRWAEQPLLPLLLQQQATVPALEIHNRDKPPRVQRLGKGRDGKYVLVEATTA
jgi:uncharacterized protein (TIGR02996 family)